MRLEVLSPASSPGPRGRGAADNPANRFQPLDIELEPDQAGNAAPPTRYFQDATRSIIAWNDSPDVGFCCSLNPYRGCEHGCIYCFARPTHEYLDLSLGLDFESRIFVKLDAPALLRKELSSKGWRPQTVAMSGVTDCYQPIERKLQITRRCLEIFLEFRNPVSIITKSHLVTRDLDLLTQLAQRRCAMVYISVTTLDAGLSGKMEPRAAAPRARLETIAELADSGVPVGVMAAPVIPGLTDHELPAILSAARHHGAVSAGYVPLRLPYGLKDLFAEWLERHFPERKEKVLNRVRGMRGGKLNDANFHSRMRGEGIFAEQIRAMFHLARRRAGFAGQPLELATEHFRRCGGQSLFE